jgi:hypothetical protein
MAQPFGDRSRPYLETLEDRLVPSTVAVSYPDGTWRYDTTAGWSHISNLRPVGLDVDDAGNVFAQYAYGALTDGIWRWSAATASWAKLTSLPGAFNVTSGGVLYGGFGSSGTWRWSPTTGWALLSNLPPADFTVSDSDAFFGYYYGSAGTWRWTLASGWQRLTSSTGYAPRSDAAGDFFGIYSAAGQQGTWRWSPTAGWARLSTIDAISIVVSASGAVYEKRGANGVWYAAPGAASVTQIDSTRALDYDLTVLPDGSLFISRDDSLFINRDDGVRYNAYYWSPRLAGLGVFKLFQSDNLFSYPSVGKDGELFFGDHTPGATGLGLWSPTSPYHLLGGPSERLGIQASQR